MSTPEADRMTAREADRMRTPEADPMRGVGSAFFVGILLLIVGTLNVFYGIAAVANSSFYVADERFVFGSLHTWGWITIILGVIQFTAAFSLFAGNVYGRVIGIIAATRPVE